MVVESIAEMGKRDRLKKILVFIFLYQAAYSTGSPTIELLREQYLLKGLSIVLYSFDFLWMQPR